MYFTDENGFTFIDATYDEVKENGAKLCSSEMTEETATELMAYLLTNFKKKLEEAETKEDVQKAVLSFSKKSGMYTQVT